MEKMNPTEKLTQWVEFKIGKLLTKDVNEKIETNDSSFDIEEYVRKLLEGSSFQGGVQSESFDETVKLNTGSDDLYPTDCASQESSDNELFDYRQLSLDSIIIQLQSSSEEVRMRAVEALESSPAEELIQKSPWGKTRKMLQDTMKTPGFERASIQILKLFRRFLLSYDSPKVVCEGFGSLAESLIFQIESFNILKRKDIIDEDSPVCGKISKWFGKNSQSSCGGTSEMPGKMENLQELEIIFKSMWLLIQSQKLMPFKWSRFNEKRLREIIFSFIHMLSSSRNKNAEYLSGVEILSVLDPRATWCNNWCHGATGRLMLCSAMKTHRSLLVEMVDFVLAAIKSKRSERSKSEPKNGCAGNFRLPLLDENNKIRPERRSRGSNFDSQKRDGFGAKENMRQASVSPNTGDSISKGNHSAPPFPAGDPNSERSSSRQSTNLTNWMTCGIPKEIIEEAKLSHCLSVVVCLIRYKSGRSLFPLQLTSRKRGMTVSEFQSIAVHHIEGVLSSSEANALVTAEYRQHMTKLSEILCSLQ